MYDKDGNAKEFSNVMSAVAEGYTFSVPPSTLEPPTDVELEVTPTADFVREADGKYYYFFILF